MTIADRLRDLIEPVVTGLGLELFDLEYGGGVLRVTVDRDGGVDLDAVAQATRAVSRALDDADPIGGHYTLEVSSPGLERTLRTPAHFAWAVGKDVSVKTVAGFEGERRLRGTIRAAGDDEVVIAGEGPNDELRLAYGDIEKARTVFEWGGRPKSGAQNAKGHNAKDQGAKGRGGKQTKKRAKAS
jgi:ribosome maturation factor RimP